MAGLGWIEAPDNFMTSDFYKNTNCKWLYQCKDCIHFLDDFVKNWKNSVVKIGYYKKNKMLKVC